MTAKKVLVEAMKLKPDDRLSVAQELFDSVTEIDEPEVELPPEVEKELERRIKEMKAHPERMIPFDVVERELDELMRKDARKRK